MARRGRSAVPAMRARKRRCRFCRASSRSVNAISAPLLRLRADLAGLARLATDVLAGVLHALRLVGVRDAERADLRRDLAHDFLVRTRDAHLLGRLEGEADAGRRVDLDRMRVAERKLQLLARERRPVAGAADLEVARVARRDAGDHVREQRAREAMEGLRLLGLVRAHDRQRAVRSIHLHERVERAPQLALRSLHRDLLAVHRHVHALRERHGKLSDPTHFVFVPYQTYARTSPPRAFFSASRPVMSPDEVETIAMPSPPRTRGISVLRA